MSFSFNDSQISASGTNYISMVRFNLDDTDSITYVLSDEMITALYNDTSSGSTQIARNYQTAIKAANYLYTKYSKMPASWSSAGSSVNRGDRLIAIRGIIDQLNAAYFSAINASDIVYAVRPPAFVCEHLFKERSW